MAQAEGDDDLDFTRPPRRSGGYNPILARMCFESFGTEETVPEGRFFFTENEMSNKMYLLIEGEANIRRGSRSLDVIKQDEIFGEMSAVTHHPRSAGVVARTPCRALSLDARQFRRAIEQTPEFGLMLMNIMVTRLRLTVSMLSMTRSLPDWKGVGETRVFDDRLLSALTRAFQERASLHYPAGKVIMKEDEGGVFMYVVLKGRVAISVGSQVVEKVGQGGVFGEMALVEQATRAASAVAESDCILLPVNRNDLLDVIKNRPEIGLSLMRAVAERLRHMDSGYK